MREVVDVYRSNGPSTSSSRSVRRMRPPAPSTRAGASARTQVDLVAPLDALGAAARPSADDAISFGSIHVQTDDSGAVERAVRQFVPRLPGRSRGSIVSQPRNGWVAVYDDVCDRDPAMLRRLARRALGPDGRRRARARHRARAGRAADPLRPRRRRRRVPLGAGVPRAAAARRRDRDRRESDGHLAPDRRRSGARAGGRAHGRFARQSCRRRRTCSASSPRRSASRARGHGWADAPELEGAVRVDR